MRISGVKDLTDTYVFQIFVKSVRSAETEESADAVLNASGTLGLVSKVTLEIDRVCSPS